MKFRVIVSALTYLALFLGKGEAGDDSTSLRNVRVRTVDPNATRISVAPRIHGGAYANEGQFKYMVFLLSYGGASHRYPEATCSASLIHPGWVLTAAHCVSSSMIAVAGRADLARYWYEGRRHTPFTLKIDELEFGVQERKVRRVIVHPDYSTVTYQNDVALLHLEQPFVMGANHPAPVAVLPLAEVKMHREMECTAIGWGLNDHQFQTFKLMFADKVYAKTPAIGCHYLLHGPFICLDEGGAGICKGDSGSPLVCHEKVWGVASFSLCSEGNADCTSTSEEYYAEIYSHLEWIRKTMSKGGTVTASPLPPLIIILALISPSYLGFLLFPTQTLK